MPFNQNLRYVHPEGCDTNDGLTWLSAKRTILSAYDSLPADPDPAVNRWGGTIYFASGSRVTTEGEPGGLWLTSADTLPSPRWRRAKRFTLFGVGADSQSSAPPGFPAASLVGFDTSQPLIWIYYTEAAMRFENIAAGPLVFGIRLGVRPEGDVSDRASDTVAHVSFHNLQLLVSDGHATYGPCVEIGDKSLWLWFTHCYFRGNPIAREGDNGAAILVRGGYDIYVENCIFSDGGFKYYVVPDHGWSFSLRNCTFEAPPPHPIHILNTHPAGRGYIEGMEFADSPTGADRSIRIEGNATPDAIIVSNFIPGLIEGPATVLNRYPTSYQNQINTPSRERQLGFWNGRVAGQHDSARRSFAPVAVRYDNLVVHDVTSWSALAKIQVEVFDELVLAPDGTMRAARIQSTAPAVGLQEGSLYVATLPGPFLVEEYVIAGVWVRESKPPPVVGNPPAFVVSLADTETHALFGSNSYFSASPPIQGDGEWEWVSAYSRITPLDPIVGPDKSPRLDLILRCSDRGRTRDFYAPILLRIPAHEISPNEAAELFQHLSTWPPGAPAGCVTTLPGQKLIARSGLGIGNAEPVESDSEHDLFVGTNIHGRMPIFDSHGDLLGHIPVYRNH